MNHRLQPQACATQPVHLNSKRRLTAPHPLARAALALAVALALHGCGGGSSSPSVGNEQALDAPDSPGSRMRALAATDPSTWLAVPQQADPLVQNLTIPATAPTRGMWSSSRPWPLNAIHAILLSDGRLLTFGTPFNAPAAQDGRFFDVWNPTLGFEAQSHQASQVADPVNSFCGTSTWLASGRLLVSGGNGNGGKSSGLFSTVTGTATADGASLAAERWYASMLTLADGRSLIIGGTVPYVDPITSHTPEIYENGRWRSLFGAGSREMFGIRALGSQPQANPWYYPRAWVAPDGSVFGITSSIMFRMRPDDNGGNGSVVQVGTFKTPQVSNGTASPNVGLSSTAVMYEPGRILQVGGNGITDNNPNLASALASIIDINGATPVVTETAPMANRRHWANATVLPDGKVVVTGGTTVGWNPANAVRAAEIWNPATGTWALGASNVDTRTYHSSALLLPNGTVFTGGGGAPGAVNNLNAEIYYPPQLFTTVNGVAQLAPRPVLQAISSLKHVHGDTLGLRLADGSSIAQVSLIALGSATHSYNNTQRRVPLVFSQAGNVINATLPASPNLAPPGYYMVFAVNAAGVPSRGTIIALGNVPAPALQPGTDSVLPPGAVACAPENGTCTVPAGQQATVYFGANGRFVSRAGQTGGVPCTSAYFGDPAPGAVKSCAYVVDSQVQAAPVVNAPVLTTGTTVNYAPAATTGATYSWSFGDGTAATPFVPSTQVTHTFPEAGVYRVTLTVNYANGGVASRTFLQAVGTAAAPGRASASSALALETRSGLSARLWVANPDNDSVAVVDTATNARVAEVPVGMSPRSVAVAPDGRVWVVNKASASISIINPGTLAVATTLALPRASQPHGLAFASGGSAFVVLEATGQLLKLNPATGAVQGSLAVGSNPRHVSVTPDGATVLVSRFITSPLPGEGTAVVNTANAGAEVLAVNAGNLTPARTILLAHSDKVDSEAQGAGIPNYLAAAAVSPDGRSAWVPSKQDNIKRGALRNGQALDFQNTVRAISSRIDMATLTEDHARRVDHDNASLGTAAAYHPSSAYLFVALETSRQVAVVDARNGRELFKADAGRAPQALAVAADGLRLYVQNFMDRTVSVLDLEPLVTRGQASLPMLAVPVTVGVDRLSAETLLGKQLFYDARDPRLARDSYMSCASCHADAGHDGRTWDFTGFGEGLRNTPALKGRAGTRHGFVHWTANFDEIQDFEAQIRSFAGGTGLMSDAQFNTGTRNTPLGDRKSGISADLDALAAYLRSLSTFDASPLRSADGALTAPAAAGKQVFANAGCGTCHGGPNFAFSSDAASLRNVGTLRPTSGQRLGGALTGIDVPTLRDAWASAPYLHDGSASTLAAAVQAHTGTNLTAADLGNLVAYLQQIGSEEGGLAGAWAFNEGGGTVTADVAGGNRPLTLANATWVAGPLGRAVQFSGAVGSSGFTDAAVVDTAQSFSVATWVRLDALTGWRTFVNQDGANASAFWLQYSETLGRKFALTMHDADNQASNGFRAIGTTTPVAGRWYHVAGVRNKAAGTMKLYVDGRLEATTAYTGGWTASGVLNIGRGKWGLPADWLAGALDDVRVYSNALSDAEVAQLHAQGAGTAGTGTGLAASYFGNTTLSGSPVLSRVEAPWFDWGNGAPAANVPANNFSVRWSGDVQAIEAGNYQFRTNSDDGVRVWVNGLRVIDNWTVHAPTVDTSPIITLAAGQRVSIVVEYQEFSGGAVLQLGWLRPGGTWQPVQQAQLYPGSQTPVSTGTGLTGSYFGNANLTGGALLTRVEVPWFDWGGGAPAANVPADNFSVRWSGAVQAMEAGTYQFRSYSDDGVRVWINGVRVIDNWTAHAPTVDSSALVTLAAGQRVSIVVEYQELGGGAVLQLSWLRPGGVWSNIPPAQLHAVP